MEASGRHLIGFIILHIFFYISVRDLVYWLVLCKKILLPSIIRVLYLHSVCASPQFFAAYFVVISLGHCLVSGVYDVGGSMMLALSKGPNRVAISLPSHED
jgi:hypothetical protein